MCLPFTMNEKKKETKKNFITACFLVAEVPNRTLPLVFNKLIDISINYIDDTEV